ncbi:MAG: cbb3-type cytochrome c oxidase subunit II [Leptospirales bacterium]
MAFREYKFGVMMTGTIFAVTMSITVLFPSMQMSKVPPSATAIQKAKDYGPESGFTIEDPFMTGDNRPTMIGKGKVIFVREGCWWCHTLLPEQTQDWQYFGAPPRVSDFVGESPTVFGSDRKAPDLLHVGSRLPIKGWHLVHHANPRAVQPMSQMPSFNYLSKKDLNALADYMMSLK